MGYTQKYGPAYINFAFKLVYRIGCTADGQRNQWILDFGSNFGGI